MQSQRSRQASPEIREAWGSAVDKQVNNHFVTQYTGGRRNKDLCSAGFCVLPHRGNCNEEVPKLLCNYERDPEAESDSRSASTAIRRSAPAWSGKSALRVFPVWSSGRIISAAGAVRCQPTYGVGWGIGTMDHRVCERPGYIIAVSKKLMPFSSGEAGRTSISCSSLVWVQSNPGVPVTACPPDPRPLSSDDRTRLASRR